MSPLAAAGAYPSSPPAGDFSGIPHAKASSFCRAATGPLGGDVSRPCRRRVPAAGGARVISPGCLLRGGAAPLASDAGGRMSRSLNFSGAGRLPRSCPALGAPARVAWCGTWPGLRVFRGRRAGHVESTDGTLGC